MSNSTTSTHSIQPQQTQQKVTLPTITNTINITNTKRVKVTLACAICRKKKVKCDGIQPSCSRCNSLGFSCEYSDPPKKRGPPKGHVEIIESRARRIESLRVGRGHKLSPVSPALVTHGANGYALIGEFHDNKILPSESNTVLRLISGAVDAVETTKYSPCSSLHQQDTSGSHYIKNDFVMKDDLLTSNYRNWTCYYFGHFNVFFPVLSRPHYTHQLSQQKVDPLLFYAVCAIGSKYCDHDQETSRLLFERCQYILNMSRDSTTLSTVQALILLCWYAYLLAKMQTCNELRQRLNLAVNDLQLYREPESSLGMVSIEMSRRAFWTAFVTDQWLSCCTGERFLVLPHGRNCQWPQLEDSQLLVIDNKQLHINSDDMVHIQKQANDSPDSVSHFVIPDLSTEYALQIATFAEMIKLACIVNEMHDLYAPSPTRARHWHHQQSIVSRLTHWLVHLPSYLEYGRPKNDAAPSPMARIYHMLYYTVQIMLYQPYLQQHQQHMDPMTIKSAALASETAPDIIMARSICTNAANTIIHISEQMIEHQQHVYLHNNFMISLALASSVHLDNAIHSNQAHSISSLLNLGKSVEVLKASNSSILSSSELHQLLNRFLVDHYGIHLDGKDWTPCRPSCSKQNSDVFMGGDGSTSINSDYDGHDDTREHLRKRRRRANELQPLCTTRPTRARHSPLRTQDAEVHLKDDLLDTRLYHLLQDAPPYSHFLTNTIPSPSSSTSVSNVFDPSWLDETSSILNLFPEAPPTVTTLLPSPQGYHSDSSSSLSSKRSCYGSASVDSLYSPVSFNSPTQSPILSPDSTSYAITTPLLGTSNYTLYEFDPEYLKSPGQYSYPCPPLAPPLAMDIYAFMSDSTNFPPPTH